MLQFKDAATSWYALHWHQQLSCVICFTAKGRRNCLLTTFMNILWNNTCPDFLTFYDFYLQEENPSREHTILRTAQKLKPFSFNKFSANGYHDFLPSRLRPKFQNVDTNNTTFSEILCLICGSPFIESELQNLENTKHKAQRKIDLYTAHCCQSCHFQILPAATDMYEHFFSLLPKFWTEKVDTAVTASASHGSLRWGWRSFFIGCLIVWVFVVHVISDMLK